jgi:hypothetical protein
MAHFLAVLPMVFVSTHVPTGDLHRPTPAAQRPTADLHVPTVGAQALFLGAHSPTLDLHRPTVILQSLFSVLQALFSGLQTPTFVCTNFSPAREAQWTARGNFSAIYIAQPSSRGCQRPVGDHFSAARSFQRLACAGFSGRGRLQRSRGGSQRVARRRFSGGGNLPHVAGNSDWSLATCPRQHTLATGDCRRRAEHAAISAEVHEVIPGGFWQAASKLAVVWVALETEGN